MSTKYNLNNSPHIHNKGLRIITILKFHLITFRMAKSKKTITINIGEVMGDREHLHNVG